MDFDGHIHGRPWRPVVDMVQPHMRIAFDTRESLRLCVGVTSVRPTAAAGAATEEPPAEQSTRRMFIPFHT